MSIHINTVRETILSLLSFAFMGFIGFGFLAPLIWADMPKWAKIVYFWWLFT